MVERQPKPTTGLNGPRLMEVVKISAQSLRDYRARANRAADYFANVNPTYTRDELLSHISLEGERSQIDAALDILNQLSVLSTTPDNVTGLVIVRKDLYRDGKLIYDIDWVHTPESLQKSTEQPLQPTIIYPFVSARRTIPDPQSHDFGVVNTARRDRERRAKDEERRKRDVYLEKHDLLEIIVNNVKENGERSLSSGVVKIELNENGEAVILFNDSLAINPDGTRAYSPVNKATGVYEASRIGAPSYDARMNPALLSYYLVKARQMEGQAVEGYNPNELDSERIMHAYQRAIATKLLTLGNNPTNRMVDRVFFLEEEKYGRFSGRYWRLDLEKNVAVDLVWGSEKPLNSQFTEFLKKKMVELNNPQPTNKADTNPITSSDTEELREVIKRGWVRVGIDSRGEVRAFWRGDEVNLETGMVSPGDQYPDGLRIEPSILEAMREEARFLRY